MAFDKKDDKKETGQAAGDKVQDTTGALQQQTADAGAAPEKMNTTADAKAPPPPPKVVKEEKPATDFSLDITEAQREGLRKKAFDTVQAELTAKAREDFLQAELERLRVEAGISKKTLGGIQDELVSIRIDLSDDEDGTADPYIQLNIPFGEKYHHGKVYTIPRHIGNTLNEIMFRNKLAARAKDGKSVFRNRTYGSVLSEAGIRHTGVQRHSA